MDVGQIRKVGRALPRFLDEFRDGFGRCDILRISEGTVAMRMVVGQLRANSNFNSLHGVHHHESQTAVENVTVPDSVKGRAWFSGTPPFPVEPVFGVQLVVV